LFCFFFNFLCLSLSPTSISKQNKFLFDFNALTVEGSFFYYVSVANPVFYFVCSSTFLWRNFLTDSGDWDFDYFLFIGLLLHLFWIDDITLFSYSVKNSLICSSSSFSFNLLRDGTFLVNLYFLNFIVSFWDSDFIELLFFL